MSAQVHSAEDPYRSGRELGLDHLKFGMWLFLASEVMFFGALLGAFIHYKVNTPSPEAFLLNPILVGINTAILLTSSLTVVLGLNAVERDRPRSLSVFLLLTIVLGFAFLGGQGYEFMSLYRQGMTLTSTVFGSSFFTLTGFHGLHVLIGIIWALSTLVRSLRGGYSPRQHLGVELFGLYWHFVDIVWIFLFTIIYLI
jgi:cytochrome c oxidase subunit III